MHIVFLACFGQNEERSSAAVSESIGRITTCSAPHEDPRNEVCSSKYFHLKQKGDTVCFCPALCKRKHGDSSLPQNCLQTSSLARLCMTIRETRFALRNTSICIAKDVHFVSGLYWSKGRMKILPCLRVAWEHLHLSFA